MTHHEFDLQIDYIYINNTNKKKYKNDGKVYCFFYNCFNCMVNFDLLY